MSSFRAAATKEEKFCVWREIEIDSFSNYWTIFFFLIKKSKSELAVIQETSTSCYVYRMSCIYAYNYGKRIRATSFRPFRCRSFSKNEGLSFRSLFAPSDFALLPRLFTSFHPALKGRWVRCWQLFWALNRIGGKVLACRCRLSPGPYLRAPSRT